MLPPQKTTFEGVEVNCPHDLENYLKLRYGYLGKDCYYNKETNLSNVPKIIQIYFIFPNE